MRLTVHLDQYLPLKAKYDIFSVFQCTQYEMQSNFYLENSIVLKVFVFINECASVSTRALMQFRSVDCFTSGGILKEGL